MNMIAMAITKIVSGRVKQLTLFEHVFSYSRLLGLIEPWLGYEVNQTMHETVHETIT